MNECPECADRNRSMWYNYRGEIHCIHRLRDQTDAIFRDLKDANTRLGDVQRELAEANTALADAEEHNNAVVAHLNALRAERGEPERRAAELERFNAEQAKTIVALRERCDGLSELAGELQEMIDRLKIADQPEMTRLQRELGAVRKDAEEQRTERDRLRAKLAVLERTRASEWKSAGVALAEFRAADESWCARYSELQSTINTLRLEVLRLDNALRDATERIERGVQSEEESHRQVIALGKQLDEWSALNAERNKQIYEQHNEIVRLRGELDEMAGCQACGGKVVSSSELPNVLSLDQATRMSSDEFKRWMASGPLPDLPGIPEPRGAVVTGIGRIDTVASGAAGSEVIGRVDVTASGICYWTADESDDVSSLRQRLQRVREHRDRLQAELDTCRAHSCKQPLGKPTREEAIAALGKIAAECMPLTRHQDFVATTKYVRLTVLRILNTARRWS